MKALNTSDAGFLDLLRREWQIKQQGWVQWLYPLVIFLMIVALFPLAIGSEPTLLARLAVPIVWIAALISLVIGMDGLFKPEFDNGTLAQLIVSGTSLPVWVLARLGIHWLYGAGAMAVLALSSAVLFDIAGMDALVLSLSILLGSPILLMLSAIASALTLSVKNSAVLVPLIAIPMQLPVLIFATGAVDRYMMGMAYLPVFALLLAGSILAVILSPWVIALSLKLAWQN